VTDQIVPGARLSSGAADLATARATSSGGTAAHQRSGKPGPERLPDGSPAGSPPGVVTPAMDDGRERTGRAVARLGAACAVAGPVLAAVFGAAHGDLPTGSIEETLRYVADRPYWRLIHLGSAIGVLGWLGAFVALAAVLKPGWPRALGILTAATAAVGTTMFTIDYLMDGHGLKAMADAWAAAQGAERDQLAATAEGALRLVGGLFRGYITLLYGLPFLFGGIATLLDGRFPRWMGVVGATAGAAAFVSGVTGFLGTPVIPDFVLFTTVLSFDQVWLVGTGVLMWRFSRG
jgi:hypothetical protein